MKLFILTAVLFFGITSMASATVNPTVSEKALKTFHQVFVNAKNVQWSSTETYNEVSFVAGTISSRAVIDNNGKLLRTIRYYKGAVLPSNILYTLKKKYESKEIFGVTEVNTESATVYYIIVRDDKCFYKVTADSNGSLTQTEKYKRGDI